MKLEVHEDQIVLFVENNLDRAFVKHELGCVKPGDQCMVTLAPPIQTAQGATGPRLVIRRAASAPEPSEEKKA